MEILSTLEDGRTIAFLDEKEIHILEHWDELKESFLKAADIEIVEVDEPEDDDEEEEEEEAPPPAAPKLKKRKRTPRGAVASECNKVIDKLFAAVGGVITRKQLLEAGAGHGLNSKSMDKAMMHHQGIEKCGRGQYTLKVATPGEPNEPTEPTGPTLYTCKRPTCSGTNNTRDIYCQGCRNELDALDTRVDRLTLMSTWSKERG